MRAYTRDNDKARRAASKPLLERFVAWVDRPGHTMDEGERQDRRRAIERLERIARESSSPPPPRVVQPATAPP